MTQVPAGPSVVWQLDAPVIPLGRLEEFVRDLLTLLNDVQADVLRGSGAQWIVETISKASPLALRVAPQATRKGVTKRDLTRVTKSVSAGLREVQRRPVRPVGYSDRALLSAQRLVTKSRSLDAQLRVDSETLTLQLAANVDQILGGSLHAIGTVEGRLEAVNVHGEQRHFYVYEALTGERVRCDFGRRMASEAIGLALDHRVSVHGEIIYRESGSIVRMTVQGLEVFPTEEDLPSADDVRGILG
jgi:hypothetical protein